MRADRWYVSCSSDQTRLTHVSSWKPTLKTMSVSCAESRPAAVTLALNAPTPRIVPPDEVHATNSTTAYATFAFRRRPEPRVQASPSRRTPSRVYS